MKADRRSGSQIDVHAWLVEGLYKPVKVTASASTGIATQEPYNCAPQTEDTITLLTEWESLKQPGRKGTAVYTASWTAPQKSGVHSEQYWNMVCSKVSLDPFRSIIVQTDIADIGVSLYREKSSSTRLDEATRSGPTRVAEPLTTRKLPERFGSSSWNLLLISDVDVRSSAST
jgi:hypothetical protein